MNLNPNAKNVYGAYSSYSSYSSYIAMPPTVAHPRTDRIRMRRGWRWLALASLLCATALRPEARDFEAVPAASGKVCRPHLSRRAGGRRRFRQRRPLRSRRNAGGAGPIPPPAVNRAAGAS